jgi:hypothetical protein
MKYNPFRLNWKISLIDFGVFVLGYVLVVSFFKLCIFNCEETGQSPFFYLGIALVFLSVLHVLINIIYFLFRKIKKGFEKGRKKKVSGY